MFLSKQKNLVISCRCFAVNGREMYQNVKTHAQSDSLYSLNLLSCAVLVSFAVLFASGP